MAIETEEWRRERQRLLDEALEAGVLPGRGEMDQYTFSRADSAHPDYGAVCDVREWDPRAGRGVYICGYTGSYAVGCALLNRALDELCSVAFYNVIVPGNIWHEHRAADVLLVLWIDSMLQRPPTETEPLLSLLSHRRDMGRVTIVTAGVPPERFVSEDALPEVQAVQAAALDCLNMAAGGPLVLHVQC